MTKMEEELQNLIKALEAGNYNGMPSEIAAGALSIEPIDFSKLEEEAVSLQFDGCAHKWVTYTGFNDSFEYCKKCDKKKQQ